MKGLESRPWCSAFILKTTELPIKISEFIQVEKLQLGKTALLGVYS